MAFIDIPAGATVRPLDGGPEMTIVDGEEQVQITHLELTDRFAIATAEFRLAGEDYVIDGDQLKQNRVGVHFSGNVVNRYDVNGNLKEA